MWILLNKYQIKSINRSCRTDGSGVRLLTARRSWNDGRECEGTDIVTILGLYSVRWHKETGYRYFKDLLGFDEYQMLYGGVHSIASDDMQG